MSEFGLSAGTIIGGKYKIVKFLSRGSLGDDVYLGHQDTLERDVTIRILPPAANQSEEYLQRFIQEIKLTAALHHPNILPAFEAGKHEGQVFLITASEKGFFLNEYLEQRGRLEQREAVKLVIPLAKALQYAWDEQKILHRNIKPETILIARENKPVLADFGMAKSLEQDAGLTLAGYTIGNPQYMSPEQVRAESDIDFRSDMYCLGLVLYEMLAGRPPFRGANKIQLMDAQASKPHLPVIEENSEITGSFSAVIDKMLAKDLNDRHRDWDELIGDFQALLKDERPPSLKLSKKTKKREGKANQKRKADQPETRAEPAQKAIPQKKGCLGILLVGMVILLPGLFGMAILLTRYLS